MFDPDTLPEFDYENWPYAPRCGFQSEGNQKYLTKSLFVETCPNHQLHYARYMLQEHELWLPERNCWVPSGWLIFINARDEYDAMRKICGNPHQWEALKSAAWFQRHLEQWEAERKMLVASQIKTKLMKILESGKGGATSAAKQLADMEGITKAVGRPAKGKIQPASVDEQERDLDEAAKRIGLVRDNS
jgi:hypothetical protein